MLNNDYFERITKHFKANRLTNLSPVLYMKITPSTIYYSSYVESRAILNFN